MLRCALRFRPPPGLATAAGIAIVLLLPVACGSGGTAAEAGPGGDTAFQKVTPSERVFTLGDLTAVGFKKSREYDVEGLTGATGAWFGWWRSAGEDPVEYEVRLYASHEDAVALGTSFADEASGKNAVLKSDDATWKGDVKDRRAVIGGVHGGVASSGVGPKYAEYVISGNMVLLCEGTTVDHSLERCESLIDALRLPQPGGD